MSVNTETYRKILHFSSLVIPIIFIFFGKEAVLLTILPILLLVAPFDYLRRKNSQINLAFNKVFELVLYENEKKGDNLCCISLTLIGAFLNFLIFKAEFAVTGFLIMIIADGLAPIISKSYPSAPFFEKSVSGSGAFFLSAFVILIGCAIYFDMGFSFYFFGLFTVMCLTIIEARPSFLNIDDNIVIPLFFGFEMSFFDIIWNYSY